MDAKKAKKVITENVDKVKEQSAKIEGAAIKEFKKIQKEMEGASKKIGAYIKKNPEKAALISAGIGAALGTVAAMLIGRKKK